MTSPRPELEAIMVAITPPQLVLPVRRPRLESSVVNRLETLEAESRESRFWGRWGPLIYLVIGAAIPLGLGVDSITRSLSLAQPGFSSRVEAEEFVLRDAGGLVRAKLAMSDRSPRLTFYDAEGNPRESLRVERESASKARPGKGTHRLERPLSSSTDKGVPMQIPLGRGVLGAGSQSGVLAATPAGGQTSQLRATPAARSGVPAGSSQGPTELPMPPAAVLNPSGAPAIAAATIPSPKLVVVGYVEKPGIGREVVVSDGFQVYVTHQGETFAERFKVVKITPTTVDIFDTYTNQSLQLGFSPVATFIRWLNDRALEYARLLTRGVATLTIPSGRASVRHAPPA